MLVLLDRDGVLNEDRPDFVKSPAELVMLPGAAEAVAQLNRQGHRVVVCTNQSCVGRGMIDEVMLGRIHDSLRSQLARAGARLDDLLVATDAPWVASARRKPAPGMLREAMAKWRSPASDCVLIGDSLGDLQAAASVGIRRILVRTGKGSATQAQGLPRDVLPVAIQDDLADAVAHLTNGAA